MTPEWKESTLDLRGVVIGDTWEDSVSGKAYDKAILELATSDSRLVIPETASVEFTAGPNQLQIFLEKSFSYCGQGGRYAIWDERHKMGLAQRCQPGEILLSTFGEDWHLEGESSIRLLLRVPSGIGISSQTGLSGKHSRANQNLALVKARRAVEALLHMEDRPSIGVRMRELMMALVASAGEEASEPSPLVREAGQVFNKLDLSSESAWDSELEGGILHGFLRRLEGTLSPQKWFPVTTEPDVERTASQGARSG